MNSHGNGQVSQSAESKSFLLKVNKKSPTQKVGCDLGTLKIDRFCVGRSFKRVPHPFKPHPPKERPALQTGCHPKKLVG